MIIANGADMISNILKAFCLRQANSKQQF
jgi:hypothetical protein